MSLMQLYKTSPFGVVGMTLMGCIFAGQFGMARSTPPKLGLGLGQLSLFVSSFFIGAIVLQYPIGWLSDRMDRRILIVGASCAAAVVCLAGMVLGDMSSRCCWRWARCPAGCAQPLYALLIAYTNDYLEYEDMAGASGGLLFVNGIGAIVGPLAMGVLMELIGPGGFWLFHGGGHGARLTAYGLWRMTQRPTVYAEEGRIRGRVLRQPILPGTASVVAVETAQELYVEAAEEIAEPSEEAETAAA
jgi:MFS family permease